MRSLLVSLLLFVFASQSPQVTFEIVSIKPNKSGLIPADFGIRAATTPTGCRGTDRGPQSVPLGRCIFTNITAGALVSIVLSQEPYKIATPPSWVTSEGFDIETKAEGPVNQEQLKQMLLKMLEDRFQLTHHREIRDVPGFALVVTKGGSRLQPAKGSAAPTVGAFDAQTRRQISIAALTPTRTALIIGQNASMDRLTAFLSGFGLGPVVDKSDVKGAFDFELRWQPEGKLSAAEIDRTGPTLATALEEQLGLKLQSQKVPIEFLVIDHIEKPTTN